MTNNLTLETIMPIVMESCMQSIANEARKMAVVLPDDMSGKDALLAFADAMEKTNDRVWPKEGLGQ